MQNLLKVQISLTRIWWACPQSPVPSPQSLGLGGVSISWLDWLGLLDTRYKGDIPETGRRLEKKG